MVKQAIGDKSVVIPHIGGNLPACISPVPFDPDNDTCGQILAASVVLPQQAHSTERTPRAPPFSSFGGRIGFAA
jgi:hypothetical protein